MGKNLSHFFVVLARSSVFQLPTVKREHQDAFFQQYPIFCRTFLADLSGLVLPTEEFKVFPFSLWSLCISFSLLNRFATMSGG
jgi:hypothetical protein